jgi:hypothetical protein
MERPPRSRQPWSHDDFNLLSDMHRDGYPRRSIAARLGRSVLAVEGMARKLRLRLQRGKTRTFQCQIDVAAFEILAAYARARDVTAPTFARIVIECAIGSPIWLTRLLDDAEEEPNADA